MSHARLGLRYPDKIVPVRNYGIEDDTPFMEMEIMTGGTLHDRIVAAARSRKRRQPIISLDDVKRILSQVCEKPRGYARAQRIPF